MRALRGARNALPYLSRKLGLSGNQAIYMWKSIPLAHVFDVADILGIPVELLRPDFFAKDPIRRAMVKLLAEHSHIATRAIRMTRFPRGKAILAATVRPELSGPLALLRQGLQPTAEQPR